MPYRDVVIFVPGIGGSRLVKGGRTLWGPNLAGQIASAFFRGSLDALTIERDSDQDDLGDGITADAVIDGLQIIPGLWKSDLNGEFCDELIRAVGLEEGRNFFRFAYDWRRDNRVSARKLRCFAEERLASWRADSGASDAQIVIVAHSMGGLVGRHYLEALEGWRSVRRLVTVGSPHRGSLNALGYLCNGLSRGIGPLSIDATAPLRSFASVYQLLPTFPCVDSDGALLRVSELSLAGLDAERVRDATTFHSDLVAAAERNAGLDGYAADAVAPVVSMSQKTFQSARYDGSRLELQSTFENKDNGGDGTVPMASAIPIGMTSRQATFVSGVHSSLFAAPAVVDHIAGLLKAAPVDLDRFRGATDRPSIAVAFDDVYAADDSIPIEAIVSGAVEQTLKAAATSIDTGEVRRTMLRPADGAHRGRLTLEPGAWRVRIAGLLADPVQDVILVAAADDRADARA